MPSAGDNLETLEEMAATIAHEIKNPLALALANLDLIKLHDPEEKYRKYCDTIEHELYSINQLVLDLIHISLVQEQSDPFDLTELLDQLAAEYQQRYEAITFLRKPGLSSVIMRGLAKNIRLVFTNLLNNAVEAVPHNGIIEISQEIVRDKIHITIHDNGPGLPREFPSKAEDFYTTKENGTGVGLRYCRSTVAKHGGQFILRDGPEGGCDAIVMLPLRI